MTGSINIHGTATVTWDTQAEVLAAPPAADGEKRKYLPCNGCGGLQVVSMNTVSTYCLPCYDKGPVTGQCEECGRDVYGDWAVCEDCRTPKVVIYA